ncbi:MAG: hypothetical protein QXT26_04385 [Thermoproteota archaeon]
MSIFAVFTSLISVCSVVAHWISWVGHPTIGAIIVTFLYLTAFNIVGRLGTTTILGILVGIVNSFVFSPLSIPVHFVRGAMFDVVSLITGHRMCCRKCVIAASILSYYVTMITIFTLYMLLGLPFVSWLTWFIIVGIPATILTVPGALLALRYRQRLRQAIGMRGE